MRNLCTLIIFLCAHLGYSQTSSKPALDSQSIANWPLINDPRISDNGKAVTYFVYTDIGESILIVQATNGKWKKEFRGASNPNFTNGGHFLIFKYPSDSIGVVQVDNGDLMIHKAVSYKIAGNDGGRWLAYLEPGDSSKLVISDLKHNKQMVFGYINAYEFSPNGNVLILEQKESTPDNNTRYQLKWIDMITTKSNIILHSTLRSGDLTLDGSGTQLVFTIKENAKATNNLLYYYQSGMDSATVIAGRNSLDGDMVIASGKIHFSGNGKKIFFTLRKRQTEKVTIANNAPQYDLWSYNDLYLKPQQKIEQRSGINRAFRAVINIGSKKVIRLEYEQDSWPTFRTADQGNAEYILITSKNDWSQDVWNKQARRDIYLVSTVSGERISVVENLCLGLNTNFYSPYGKYVIWYDREKDSYFTYNIEKKKILNISSNFPTSLSYPFDDFPDNKVAEGIMGWAAQDKDVYVYDEFDIWKIDPDGQRQPINITSGYGKAKGIVLRNIDYKAVKGSVPVISEKEELILAAFKTSSKYNGYFALKANGKQEPKQLTFGPYLYNYCFHPQPSVSMSPTHFLKAQNTNAYVVTRMNSEQYPNLYFSKDLKEFSKISNLQPEQRVNWLSSQLIRWKTFDGKDGEGILYKPENFDSNKKYPVIFHFYEKNATGLYNFLHPSWSDGPINIPYFVSKGYIVFDPNINYEIGNTKESVFNSVVSAARYLSQFSWIDTLHMGIQGHSFGGYEVNCLVTSTSLFSAAVSAAGFCNLTSMYGNIRSDFGITGINLVETGQTRIGAKPWEYPELFIKNSPIFFADKVTTPLLIMHNKGDGASAFSQSLEFFNALRRLQKKVWLLDYENSSHQVEGLYNKMDYTQKLLQFFDCYLKGAPPPSWMSKGGTLNILDVSNGF